MAAGAARRSGMSVPVTKASLSPPERRLVEVMQRMNYGRIEGLVVREGQPVVDPPPRIVCEIKFGAKGSPEPRQRGGEFTLKAQVQQLFAYFARMGNGTVEKIEVQDGLPFRMNVEERFRP